MILVNVTRFVVHWIRYNVWSVNGMRGRRKSKMRREDAPGTTGPSSSERHSCNGRESTFLLPQDSYYWEFDLHGEKCRSKLRTRTTLVLEIATAPCKSLLNGRIKYN
ncbi:unnamed protein product [Allacma fusca]|uniref:Uncharacterized protein n=1 Tax=Allacma fusca TaxID=39272 RepID=A0A8J2NQ02_9HEXA|nr:unnamed protein product [Allacma fusca]